MRPRSVILVPTDDDGPGELGLHSATPLKSVIVPVGIISIAISAFCFSATKLWLSPEARGYIVLAGGIAERLDFSHDLFLLRTPGYPIILAALFKAFGPSTPEALRVLQFSMIVATGLLVTAIAWRLTHRRAVALIAGVLCACNVQLLGFANMVMSEVPFTLTMTLSVYWVIRFLQSGRAASLGFSSLWVGVGYLIRPVGLVMIGLCFLAIFMRIRREPAAFRFGRGAKHLLLASLPAMIFAGPWMFHLHQRGDMSASLGPTFYRRTVTVDRLDLKSPQVVEDIRNTVDEAKRLGTIRPDSDFLYFGTVIEAYTLLGRESYAQTCVRLKEIGTELIREHADAVAWRSVLYAVWTICEPDTSWRFIPGGAPGTEFSEREWRRAPEAEFWDCATYEPMMRPLIEPFLKYLPLNSAPTGTTPAWTSVISTIHRISDTPVPALGRRVYECLVLLSLLGFLFSVLTPTRSEWLLVGLAIFLHVFASSLLIGPVPRYAVPIQPLLPLGGIWLMTSLIGSLIQRLRHRRCQSAAIPALP